MNYDWHVICSTAVVVGSLFAGCSDKAADDAHHQDKTPNITFTKGAVEKYMHQAEAGDANAACLCVHSLMFGEGGDKNLDAAIRYAEIACKGGSPTADYYANRISLETGGLGWFDDFIGWAVTHENELDVLAQCGLAYCYLHGEGVDRDVGKALSLLENAASRGFAHAQYVLGEIYELGFDAPRNGATAREWFRKAAMQGHGKAAAMLNEPCSERL